MKVTASNRYQIKALQHFVFHILHGNSDPGSLLRGSVLLLYPSMIKGYKGLVE